jgi:hypothetical protein
MARAAATRAVANILCETQRSFFFARKALRRRETRLEGHNYNSSTLLAHPTKSATSPLEVMQNLMK